MKNNRSTKSRAVKSSPSTLPPITTPGAHSAGGDHLPRFRMKITGDSMAPKYPNGTVVEFIDIQWDKAGAGVTLKVGADYFVRTPEGHTFKRLRSFDDKSLVLRAINRKTAAREVMVERARVNQIGVPEFICKPLIRMGNAMNQSGE